MSLRNTENSFGSIAKFFHWLIALCIIGLIIVGLTMVNITDKPLKMQIFNYHKLFGLTVLALVILRILWRWVNIVPKLPASMPRWEFALESAVKFALYFCILLMPISGWIFSSAAGYYPHIGNIVFAAPGIPKSKAIAEFFKQVHITTAWVLIGLLVLHILGALKHHFINKDNILRRMMPGSKND